jgi:hypothetical protein
MTTRHAACSCGQLNVVVKGDPVRISICHCHACQRRTGSTFGAQARFPRDRISIEGTSTQYVRTADSGNQITFHFCPTCGATVFYAPNQEPELIAIPVGAFAEPGFPAPTVSVYEARMHSWTGLPPDVEHID